ncbi:hypothetical protein LOTGIDRAFT_154999 [Lottia gigantea]|uniref:Uncharacterized protein n=1 Tax=Lottia gigantea TaxID=225164 RepID=V3ZMH7_LOTGI|nr:hypothetical protein LOTGIDRAFT_154999 [Lottia gigantea]ESO85512.1 hypothetical protein LOTGIDRAFT_154999 [Lottia gigantea]
MFQYIFKEHVATTEGLEKLNGCCNYCSLSSGRTNKFIKRSSNTDEIGMLKENQDDHNSDDEIEETNEKIRSTLRVIRYQQYENNRVEVEAAMNAEIESESTWDEQAPGTQQVNKDDEHEENIQIENLKKKREPLKI